MREATPAPVAAASQPRPNPQTSLRRLGKAMGDSLRFCEHNLAATTIPSLLLGLPAFLAYLFSPDPRIGNALQLLLGVAASCGIIRLVFLAHSIKEKPTVAGGLIEGFSFWPRGIIANLIVWLSLCLVCALIGLLMAPGLVIMKANRTGGIIYFAVTGVPSLWVLVFSSLRLTMTIPAMMDDGLTIEGAFTAGLKTTKGRTSELFWIFFLVGLACAILGAIYLFGCESLAGAIENVVPIAPAITLIYILTWPLHFLVSWFVVTLAQTYLAMKHPPSSEGKPLMAKSTLNRR